jgi:hypothetical protein
MVNMAHLDKVFRQERLHDLGLSPKVNISRKRKKKNYTRMSITKKAMKQLWTILS